MSILISIFISGYHGKTTDFAKNSSCHRTTIAHFLNSGKWDDSLLADALKRSVIEIIYSEATRTGKPVFCIVDDTIASKTKPSSLAHFICVSGTGEFSSFENGYHRIGSIIQIEKYRYLFQCAKESNDFNSFMKLAV